MTPTIGINSTYNGYTVVKIKCSSVVLEKDG